jgi:cell division septation protein DedD
MNLARSRPAVGRTRREAAYIAVLVALMTAGLLLPVDGAQAATTVPLGTTDSFAILGGSTITNTGPSVVTGDIGLHPGTSVTGFGPGADQVTQDGSLHVTDGVALQAKNDLTTAYNDAAGQTPVTRVPTELGTTTLKPGVYDSAAGTFGVTGTLTLDAEGNPDAVFIFKMASTLTTASASSVSLINGADVCNVFWQVGSSATLGTNSTFRGTVMALTSITLNNRATVEGRVLAREGAVTLDTNVITNAACTTPEPTPTPTPTPTEPTPTEPTPTEPTPTEPTPTEPTPTEPTTTGGDTTGGDTTGQVRDVPRGSVAAGGGGTANGAIPLMVAGLLMLVAMGGTAGVAVRRRARA